MRLPCLTAKLNFAASTTAAGGINFGGDTDLYRGAEGTLKTDGVFWAGLGWAPGAGSAFATAAVGDSSTRFYILNTGDIHWGSGTSAADTNFYCVAANWLKTDGLFTAGSGLVIGSGGSTITRFLSATTTWDPPSIATGTAVSTTLTVTGAAMGDTVDVGFSQAPADGMSISGWVPAANTVKVTLVNLSGATQDLPAGTLRADVWQHQRACAFTAGRG